MASRNRKKVKFLSIEKRMIKLCVILLLLFPVIDVFSKATLSEANIRVEKLKQVITAQEKKNQSLTMKVNELKSFDKIEAVIEEQGLAYNCNNIKVIAKD